LACGFAVTEDWKVMTSGYLPADPVGQSYTLCHRYVSHRNERHNIHDTNTRVNTRMVRQVKTIYGLGNTG
jgi:hypothetical protein